MTSVPRALAWTMWRQHRRWLRFLGVCLMALTALSTALLLSVDAWVIFVKPWMVAAIVASLLVLFLTALVILSYGNEGTDLIARESCYPPALFRLPVSTAWLAAWPIGVGAATVSSLWVAVTCLLLQPWIFFRVGREVDTHMPICWPALLAAAIMGWCQALLWLPFGLPWLRIGVFIGICSAGLYAPAMLKHRSTEAELCALFGACTVTGWGMAYLGVRRARHGDSPDWRYLLAPVHRLLRRLSGPRTAFLSASRAQFWMERRLSGYSLPFMMVLVTPFLMWPLFFLPNLDEPLTKQNSVKQFSAQYIVLMLMIMPIFFAGVFGASGGGGYSPGIKSRKTGLGSFVAGLPMTTTDMVSAMLRSVTFSTLLTWVWMFLSLALSGAILLAFGPSEAPEWWRRAMADVPAAKFAIGVAATTILAIVWTWKRQIDRLHFTLSGRVWVGTVVALSAVALWVLLGVIAVLTLPDPPLHPPSRDFLDAVAPWVLGGVMVLRLVAAVWAIREVVRRGFVRRRTAVLGVAGWLLLAAALIGILVWTVPAALVPVHYVVFAVLFALPMVRLIAAPLVLDWNRHR